ncbi:MAG TPA: carboxypeptidase regulatory-like domain-containing protein [Terriglobales bacterium]|nr:carboxypeptidase regulatory-like domain-containing protein [Terriglobales bacterium]
MAKSLSWLLLVFSLANTIEAQTGTGLICGTVNDPSHAVVSGAKVVALEIHTQSTRSTTTNKDGFYSLSQLQPGDYDVSVEAAGFATYIAHTEINVGARITVDVLLSLAAVQANMAVIASGGVQVETQTPMLSEVVNDQQITQLPTLTRNPYDLVLLAGIISPGDPAGRGVGVAINGQRSASTDVMLDGGENTDVFMSEVGLAVPLDSVKEFRLSEGTFTAEYGRASGGMVDVETRSGTNAFHGSVYEFNRISALAANSFDNNARGFPRGVFTRNQFGHALGGPILKNRLFFFQSTEWTRVRSEQTVLALVPTPQYIAASAPATQTYFTTFGGANSPINGTILTKADLLAFGIRPRPGGPFDLLPLDTPVFGQAAYTAAVAAGTGDPQNSYSLLGRLDFSASENTKVFARLAAHKEFALPGVSFTTPYPGYEAPFTYLHKNLLAGVTHVFSPTLVSMTKVGFSRLDHQFPLGANPLGPALLFPGNFSLLGIGVTLPGYAYPATGGTQYEWQISQDLNWTHSKHLWRAGGQFLRFRTVRAGYGGGVASQLLGHHAADSLDNFLAGQLTSFQVAIDPQGKFPCFTAPDGTPIQTPACTLTLPLQSPIQARATLNRDSAAYVQDTWRMQKRVTLNLGLRWEYYGVQYSGDSNPEANFYLGDGSNFAQQIRNGQVLTVPDSPIHSLWRPDYNNFGPRIGFAWDVFGTGTTSLRGGYGISYERNFGKVFDNLALNPPGYAFAEADSGTPQFPTLDISTVNLGPFAGSSGTIIFPQALARQVDTNIRTAYAETWSLSMDHQILPNTVLSLWYSGSHGVHLYSDTLTDLPGSGIVYGGDDPAVNPFSTLSRQYNNITTRSNGGSSNYHALLVRVKGQNVKHTGLSFTANYTWSHAIDNLSSTLGDYPNDFHFGFLDFLNPSLDRGDAEFDIRQRFVGSAIWQTRWFATSSRRWEGLVFGGWSIAPIFTASTGKPFSVWDCTNAVSVCPRYIPSAPVSTTGHAVNTGEPNFFSYIPLPPAVPYANPLVGFSDFGDCSQVPAPPCPFPANMTRRDEFRGPGEWMLDLGIYKGLRLNEKWDLQFRGELFNAFNHPNLYVNSGLADIAFLDFVSASKSDNRNIQLALKLNF